MFSNTKEMLKNQQISTFEHLNTIEFIHTMWSHMMAYE